LQGDLFFLPPAAGARGSLEGNVDFKRAPPRFSRQSLCFSRIYSCAGILSLRSWFFFARGPFFAISNLATNSNVQILIAATWVARAPSHLWSGWTEFS